MNEGLEKVIPAFEKKMETLVYYPSLETQLSLDMIVIEQVKHLKGIKFPQHLNNLGLGFRNQFFNVTYLRKKQRR